MALQIYALGQVLINGTRLIEEAQMSISRKTHSQAVLTVAGGYSGESPGAPMCEVDITEAVPSAAFDTGYAAVMNIDGLAVVEFQLWVGAYTLTFKGFIIEDNFHHAVNSEAKMSFKARGQFARYKI